MGQSRSLAAACAVAVVGSLVLTGCFTGKRPTLAPAAVEVNDPAVRAVLDRLETANDTQYTANYRIVTKIGTEAIPPTDATVAQTSATDRSITIGNVRFLDQGGTQQTCDLIGASCKPAFDDATVSNLLVNHDFFAISPAARLRQDSTTMVSDALASTREIAGQVATCVQVNFAAGNKTYCALDNGLLAYQDTPDLQIDLVGLAPGADPALFSTTTAVPTAPTLVPTATIPAG